MVDGVDVVNGNTQADVDVLNDALFPAQAGDTHTFTLVTGAGSSDNGSFQITGNQLQVKAGTVLDHETQPSYSVRIRATDQGNLSFEKPFTISVTDVNEPTTVTVEDSRIRSLRFSPS